MKKILRYFSKIELGLLFCSCFAIICSYIIFSTSGYLTLVASLIGVVSLLFSAKGNPFGQFLIIIFSLLYGIISFNFSYYGEVATYIGMTLPMATFSFISWMKNPYNGNKSQVTIYYLKHNEWVMMVVLTTIVTVIFYFVLKFFSTSSIYFSTMSVTTSFTAVYLTFKRSHYFALAYALNDIVLIVLWTIAAFSDISYVSVVVCFVAFLINDIYSYYNWKVMGKAQKEFFS